MPATEAMASSTQLCALAGEHGPAPDCASFMDGTVYVPVYAGMPDATLDRMAEIIRNHGVTLEPAAVEETELTPVPLGK